MLKASRRGAVDPMILMEVLAAASIREAAGETVLHLEIGQPGSPAPAAARRAAAQALERERIGYTVARGISPLREAIAAQYASVAGIKVQPEAIVVTTGSTGGFVLAFLAAFDAGDRVGLLEPGYPAYRNILSALGLEPVAIPVGPGTRYQIDPDAVDEVLPGLDGLILASPANPTGTMPDDAAFDALAAACERHGTRLISDEIYHGITFGRPARSALACSESAIVVNSFSKYYCMTGWRLGWVVVPADLRRQVDRLAQNLYISAPTLSQHAAVAALDCRPELDELVAGYARNQRILLEALPRAGFRDLVPADGAFYLYADVSHLCDDSADFCARMLAATGVAATPGADFDPARGHGTTRFSFCAAEADVTEAARRLIDWLG